MSVIGLSPVGPRQSLPPDRVQSRVETVLALGVLVPEKAGVLTAEGAATHVVALRSGWRFAQKRIERTGQARPSNPIVAGVNI